MKKLYTAALTGPDKFVIIDANTGIKINTISTGGKIVNGPIVTDDKVTCIIQKSSGAQMGKVFNMPSGSLSTQFEL